MDNLEKKIDEPFSLDLMKIGYCIVYKGNDSWFSNQIKKAQIDEGIPKEDADYTHVETSIGGPWSIGAILI